MQFNNKIPKFKKTYNICDNVINKKDHAIFPIIGKLHATTDSVNQFRILINDIKMM